MYKVLIADDEPLVIIGLQSIINWQEHNMQIIGTAKNGEQAIALIEQFSPDIVITDIKMPVKTGLEIIEHCAKNFSYSPEFIILTSYDEFSYAQKALQLNAVDYLIKLELTCENLLSALNKAIDAIKKNSTKAQTSPQTEQNLGLANFKDKFFVRLYNNLFESEAQFLTQQNNLQLKFNSDFYTVVYCKIIAPSNRNDTQAQINFFTSNLAAIADLVQKYLPCYVTSLDIQHFCICFCSDNLAEIEKLLKQAKQLVYNYFSATLHCAVGVPVNNISDVYLSFNSAKTARTKSKTTNDVIFADNNDIKAYGNFNTYKEKLAHALKELNKNDLQATMDEVISELQHKTDDFAMALNILTSTVYLINTLLPDGQYILNIIFKDENESYRCIYNCKTTDACCQRLSQIKTQLCTIFFEGRKSYKQRIVINVQQYIDDNLNQKLSLQEISAIFNFTPSYLSKLFTEYASCNFVEYVTKERIKKAKQLLLEGNTKIYEVAQNLGFENTFYFSKVFKKQTGLSPREFIQQNNY